MPRTPPPSEKFIGPPHGAAFVTRYQWIRRKFQRLWKFLSTRRSCQIEVLIIIGDGHCQDINHFDEEQGMTAHFLFSKRYLSEVPLYYYIEISQNSDLQNVITHSSYR